MNQKLLQAIPYEKQQPFFENYMADIAFKMPAKSFFELPLKEFLNNIRGGLMDKISETKLIKMIDRLNNNLVFIKIIVINETATIYNL